MRYESRDIEKGESDVEEIVKSLRTEAEKAMMLYTYTLEKTIGKTDYVVRTIKLWESGW